MNSSLQNPPSISSSHRNDGSSNSRLLQKDVSPHDHQVALELERLHELRHQVAAQEQKLQSLRQQASNGEGSHNLLAAEQNIMKSLIFTKEKELALALMKVAELTSQLEQLRRGHVEDIANKSSQKRIESSGLLATCDAEQHLKGSHQKAIPIKVIKESVHLNNDLRKNSAAHNAEEKPKSDRERGVRIIPIVFEKKAVGVSSAAVAEGPWTQGTIKVTCNKSVLGQNFNAAVQNAIDACHNTDLSSKKSFSTDLRSSSVTNNFFSDKGTEIGVENSTSGPEDIETDGKSEKKAEINAGSLPAHSESSTGNVFDDKKVENEKVIPIQCSMFRLADSLSYDKRILDPQSSFAINKDNNWTKNLFSNSSVKKPADVMNNALFDKKEIGLSQTADKQDVCSTKNVCDKMNDSYNGNVFSEKTDGSKLKTFSQSKKSFSDFSLSTQLGQPIRESFSSMNQAGQMASPWDIGISVTKQHPPLATVGNSAIKSDRARFFMDMVREDDAGAGSGQPLQDSVRLGRGFVEVKPSASSTGSSTTSRGRSSSSAIMSRFAPQPYGRSKSVDSGSLRVPMMAVHGALRREQSPEVMGIDSKTVSSSTTTPLSEPNPPLFSSSTVLQLQTVPASPVQATVTKASQDRQQFAEVHVPTKEATLPEFGTIASQLSKSSGRPSYVVPTVSPSLSLSLQKIADTASLEKSVPDSKLFFVKTAASGKTTGDTKSPVTSTVTVVITGTALSYIDHSVIKLSQTDTNVTSVMNTATDSNLPTTSGHLVTTVATVSGVVPGGSVLQDATAAKMVTCSLGTSRYTPTEIESSKSKLAAGSGITAVSSYTKSIASVKVSPSMPSSASASSDAKLSPFASMPVSARVFQGNSLASEPSAGDFRTVSVVTRSTSPSATAFANSESTAVHTAAGTVPKAQPSVSKAEDLQSAEEMADTPWDSNVKRLAHIYAVTIGGTVKSKGNLHGSRSKVSDYAAGANNCAQVAPLTDVSKQGVPSIPANGTEHSKHENYLGDIADGKSSVVLSAKVSTGIGCLDTSSRSDSRGAVSPSAQHQQIHVSTADHSHSTNSLPRQPSPDVAQVSSSKAKVLEQSKIDTSIDSVNTALSVLLQNNSSGHGSPVRPSRLRNTISSAYRRKLGSGALDNYSQNMTLLYGGCITKKDDFTSLDVRDYSMESIVSPPVLEAPLIEDLPRILALDTLDGMPFYPGIGSHLICRESQRSNDRTIGDKAIDQLNNCNELLKTGDVELTVVANPVQSADLVRLDSAETATSSTLASFSPSDALVTSYIDDPETSDQDRFISETPARRSSRLFRKDGKPQRHVTFDAVSLLLNAALEGEKDLVIDVVNKITNPNHKTDNGLSALHNAVCGGHVDIVRYLVAFGCDVNATDNDGWTPLHCAASSNNLEMMQILVENGASILPLTISDRETPVQKCSRSLPGYEEAARYLTDVARNLGVENDGWVYVTSNFTNVCSDELVLHDGDCLKVLRRGDESEIEWWWARDEKNAEGYIPQSLLALFPRIQPKWQK